MGNIRVIDQGTVLRVRSAMVDVQAELIESVAGIDRMMASLTAHRAALIDQAHQWAQASVDLVVPVGQPAGRRAVLAERSFVAELGCVLRMPESSAQKLAAESAVLVRDLPASFEALSAGRIGYAHARVIVEETYGLDVDARHELESAVVEAASRETPSRLRAKTRRVRERLHPGTVPARMKSAVADRSMNTEPARDGMGWLTLYLQAPLISGIDDRVGQVAQRMKKQGDPRTLTQLRADIAAMLLLGEGTGVICTGASRGPETGSGANAETDRDAPSDANGSPDAPAGLPAEPVADHHGGSAIQPLAALLSQVRPEMDVMVPVLTLLGRSEEPGTLNGTIPIDADTARRLAAVAPSFTRILTHPETGVVLSVGRTRYRPPPDLARWLRRRDGTCRFPGCNRHARHTEIDHTVQRQAGGPTQADNLACFCGKHHHLKDETTWRVIQHPGGVLQWTSPTGRIYTTHPQLELPTPEPHDTVNIGDEQAPF